ncbi:MAG: hypothetical protein J1E43_12650 [Christensenellaceae bacterium]|nr:hypothetical protein [Christensenellaceae bacterium]
MSLTRKLLRELHLEDAHIERIIAAHVETVDALRQERDALSAQAAQLDSIAAERDALRDQVADLTAHRDEAARIQADFDAYRAQVDADRLSAARQSAIRAALLDAGANPQAVDLLAGAVVTDDAAWEEGRLKDAAGTLAPVRERYASLFARPVPVPTPRLSPPGGDAPALTRDDVGRMSEQEILANWGAVQSALRGM